MKQVPKTSFLGLALIAAAAGSLSAQSEEQLRSYFEGKRVVVRVEMPGSEEGVDVFPGTGQPIDFPRHAERLKRYGTSIRPGDEVLVTKVKVKRDLIEFQLGGGGYGTFGDDDGTITVPAAAKTEREKNLEREIERTTDPARRRRLREERDALRKEREREDARNRAEAAQAQQAKEANVRQRRIEGGSRFNIRYRPYVPAEAMTPEGIMQALAQYLDFSPLQPNAGPAPTSDNPLDQLRKGLTSDEVDALLGRPEAITERQEGTLTVSTSRYRFQDRRITAEFVEGVLIRFIISSS